MTETETYFHMIFGICFEHFSSLLFRLNSTTQVIFDGSITNILFSFYIPYILINKSTWITTACIYILSKYCIRWIHISRAPICYNWQPFYHTINKYDFIHEIKIKCARIHPYMQIANTLDLCTANVFILQE